MALHRKDYTRAAQLLSYVPDGAVRHVVTNTFIDFFLGYENFDKAKFINHIDKLVEDRRAQKEKTNRIESLIGTDRTPNSDDKGK